MSFGIVQKSQNNVGRSRFLYQKYVWGVRLNISLLMGKLGIGKSQCLLYQRYDEKQNRMHQERLSKSEIEDWTKDNADSRGGWKVLERKKRNEKITDEILKNESQQMYKYQQTARLIKKILETKKFGIKQVCHFGARVDTISDFFSKSFKAIEFHSIDMQSNLVEINQKLGSRRNWHCHNAYGLEFLENTKIKPDLALFISTGGKLTNAEFDIYMKTFAKKQTSFLIFRESWWSMPISRLFFQSWMPEKTLTNISPVAGPVADFQHNYFYFLERHGYAVIMAEFNPVANSRLSNEIYILAVRKDLALSASKALNFSTNPAV